MIILDNSIGKEDIGESIKKVDSIDIDGNIDEKPKEKISDKYLVYAVIGIILIFAIIFSIKIFFPEPKILNLDDLHLQNLKGELSEEKGYVYSGYSFVKFDDMWYSQVQARDKRWDVPFRFGPRELEDVKIEGRLNAVFLNATEIYMTFNPLGSELQYIALAIGEMDQSLVTAFGIIPIGACDKNETSECKKRPIVTCEDKDKAVVYYKQNTTLRIIGQDNCLIIEGNQFDIVKGVDRVLMRMYGIIE